MKLKAILSGLTLVLLCTVGFSQTTKNKSQQKQVAQKHKISEQTPPHFSTKKNYSSLKAKQKELKKTKITTKLAPLDGNKNFYKKKKTVTSKSPYQVSHE